MEASGEDDAKPVAAQRRPTNAELLGNRQFRIVLSARTVSWFGDAFVPVALPFSVFALGGGIREVGMVLAVSTLATVASTLWGGVIGDGYSRRRILITSDLVQGTLVLLVALLLWADLLEIWSLTVLMALVGLATGVAFPCFSGLIPQVVEPDHLQATSGLLSVTMSVAQLAGPGLAGVLVVAGSPEIALGANGLTFLVSACLIGRLRLDKADRLDSDPVRLLHDLRIGWRELRLRQWYWVSILAHGSWNFGFATYFVLGPVISRNDLGGPGAWGAAGIALAAGSIVGGSLLLRVTVRRPVVTVNGLLPLGALPLLALIGPLPLPLFLASVVLLGMVMAGANGAWEATAQRIIPLDVLSRLSSFDWLVSLGIMSLGYALAGPLSAWLGTDTLLWIAAATMVVPCLLTLAHTQVRSIRRTESGDVVGSAAVPAS